MPQSRMSGPAASGLADDLLPAATAGGRDALEAAALLAAFNVSNGIAGGWPAPLARPGAGIVGGRGA